MADGRANECERNKSLIKADFQTLLTFLIDGNQSTRRAILDIIRDRIPRHSKDNRPIEEAFGLSVILLITSFLQLEKRK